MDVKAAMPETAAAMRRHMEAEPPSGHGRAMAADAAMTEMTQMHDAMHADGAAHDHAPMKAEFLKAEQLTSTKWRVLSIPFGGPFKGKDLDDEFFSPRTDIKADWFERRPTVWHHNLDKTMVADPVVGIDDDLELDEKTGWWSTLWLDRSHRYWREIDALLRAGKVYGSSGSLPNFVRKDRKTGEILVWPFIEQTLTPTPANPYSVVVAAKAIDHFDDAGIALDDRIKAVLADLDAIAADLRGDLSDLGDAPVADLSEGGEPEATTTKADDEPVDPWLSAKAARLELELFRLRRRL